MTHHIKMFSAAAILRFCLFAFAVMIVSCGGKNAAPTTSTTVRVGYLTVTSGLPLFVGIEQGYFKEEGITIESQLFQTSNQLADALLANRIDMDAGTSSFVLAGLAQEPERLNLLRVALCIEVDSTRWMSRLVVSANSPWKSIEDIRTQKESLMIG